MTIPTAEQLLQMPPEQAIGLLLGIIADLQRQLLDKSGPPKDSSNSSKPPASDIVPRTRSLRRPSGKKPGGQAGHRGHTRRQTDMPDLVRVQRPSACSECGAGLDATLDGTVVERRQVIDLPPTRAVTTEYQSLAVTCSHCHKATVGQFPPEATAALSFGPRLQATVTDLRDVHHLSYQRLQRALRDHFGCSISQASLVGLIDRAARQCRPAYEAIRTAVVSSPVIGCDETGQKVTGRGHWLWTFRTPRHTYLVSSPSRGSDVIAGVLGGLTTPAAWVSDRWKAQFKVQAAGGHQLCVPHLLRELQFGIDAQRSAWAYEVALTLRRALALRRRIETMVEAGQDSWSEPSWVAWRERAVSGLERRLDAALAAPTRHKVDRKLQKTLSKPIHRAALTLFLRRGDVPADNNGSERDLRAEKVHQKVIGGFRSPAGAEWHSILMSVIQTASKQQQNILGRLAELFGTGPPIQVSYHLAPPGG